MKFGPRFGRNIRPDLRFYRRFCGRDPCKKRVFIPDVDGEKKSPHTNSSAPIDFLSIRCGRDSHWDMDSYVNSLKSRDAHTFPPCRKVYKNELHQKISQKFLSSWCAVRNGRRDVRNDTFIRTVFRKLCSGL
jgi:hypothetical protein